MEKSSTHPLYALVTQKLARAREQAGFTMRELADRLEREHSFVWRIETGERRVDLLELVWVCRACEVDPVAFISELAEQLATAIDADTTKSKRGRGRRSGVQPADAAARAPRKTKKPGP